jgi:transcriptional regulator with XRE-family HTH domain
MGVMNMQPAAIYFYELIDLQGLKIGVVQEKADVGENYLWRLMNGKIKRPSWEKLQALVDVLQGDITHVKWVLRGEHNDPRALAKEAVRKRLSDEEIARLQARAREEGGGLSPRQIDKLATELEASKNDHSGATRQRRRRWLRNKLRP